MRAFWLTVLMTGLLLITIDTYEAAQSGTSESVPCSMDDGTGSPTPQPAPTPVTK
jgi:hypothetical protein